jgi:hypothetical protein
MRHRATDGSSMTTDVRTERVALEGSFADLPLVELLPLLAGTKQTGTLYVSGQLDAAITMVDGELSFATNDPTCSLREVLINQGLITPAVWDAATSQRDSDLGPALVRTSGHSAAELRVAVHEHILSAVYELVTVEDGKFRFVPGPRYSMGDGYSLSVEALQEALDVRRGEWEAIADTVPNAHVVVVLNPSHRTTRANVCVTARDWPVVAAIDGTHAIIDLVGVANLPVFAICQAVHRLVAADLARIVPS